MVRCPFCGCEEGFSVEKRLRFRFYRVLGCSVLAVKEYSTTIAA